MMPICRRSVIIGSQTPYGDYLLGVEEDLKTIRAYQLSLPGGAWMEGEQVFLLNPTVAQVLRTIGSTVADYVFVYFSGHGYTNQSGQRMLCLTDGDLSDISLLTPSQRQLLLVDACRTFGEKPPARIGAISPGEEDRIYGVAHLQARMQFDGYIARSPAGTMIVHSTAHGELAYDDLYGNGGLSTLALMGAVNKMLHTWPGKQVLITEAIGEAARLLRTWGVQQVPSIAYETGHLAVPFGIAVPAFNAAPRPKMLVRQPQNAGLPGFAVFAGIALSLYAISKLTEIIE